MFWRAARKSRKENPTVHHRVATTTASRAVDFWVSQGVVRPRTWLTMPLVGWNSHHQQLPMTAEGSRNGAKKHRRHSHLKCTVWWAISAISRATTTMHGTTYKMDAVPAASSTPGRP